MGFDFSRGRLDRSTHPFTMMSGDDDVRLTIRTSADDPLRAIFATLHEGGHALYDQGLPRELRGTLLADVPSMGLHESAGAALGESRRAQRRVLAALLRQAAGGVPRSAGQRRRARSTAPSTSSRPA